MSDAQKFQLGTIGALSLSVVSSVSIVICNKALISTLGFTFATTLTSWHLLVTFCSLHVALWMKFFEHKPFDPRAVLGFGVLNGISIGLLNLSLGFNSVGFYQMTKLAIIPCTVVLETIFFRKMFSRKIHIRASPVFSLSLQIFLTAFHQWSADLAFEYRLRTSMSSCLLPQFKCPPDSFSIHFRTSFCAPKHNKGSVFFQPQCAVSTSPALLTSMLDVAKLRLPSFDTDSDSLISDRQWTYTRPDGPSTEAKYLEALASETLLTSDEAVVVAAAAEAVALARAAVKVAKDATLFKNSNNTNLLTSSTADKRSKWDQFTEKERAGILGHLAVSDNGIVSDKITASASNKESIGDLESEKQEEVELLEEQPSVSLAVRSTRQTERKARRAKGLEKTASGIPSVKTGSSPKKKRLVAQEVDHNDPLRYLRMTTSSSKLLTVREEHELSAGIQDLLKLERLQTELTERSGRQPTFAQWASAAGVDQKSLRQRIHHGTLCKDKMIKSNIRLVISIAKNYQGAGMNLQDLVQEGCRGLVRGAEKFDATKGFKFSTYAHWWIKQAVRKSLSDQSRMIRLPFHMVEATYRVKEARKQLYSETGKHPKNEEIAEATGLSMKRLMAVLLSPKPPRSLDQKIGMNQNLKPSEVIADPEAVTSEDILIKEFMRQDLDKVLDSLGTREKQVIRWRFGMEDGRMKTLQEIGEMMGVSRERVRQIESSAFRKLKNKKRNNHLQQYLVAQS